MEKNKRRKKLGDMDNSKKTKLYNKKGDKSSKKKRKDKKRRGGNRHRTYSIENIKNMKFKKNKNE